MILGYKDYTIIGDDFHRLYRLISKEKIPVRKMCEKCGKLFLRLSAGNYGYFEKICYDNSYSFEQKKIHGFSRFLMFLRHRLGLLTGCVAVIGIMIYLSNIALRFEVLSDNDVIKGKIFDVLESEGITAGVYIPDINYVVVERELRQKIDEISWAGITREGNSLVIDVVENIDMPQFRKERLPSNLVACENAQIDKIECKDGQIKLGVGCGVVKGDVIVSGEVVTSKTYWKNGEEMVDTRTRYARSIGKVYGSFERTISFEQPFEDRQEVDTGKTDNLRYINFFSADIPLFLSTPDGYYKSQTSTSVLELFGFDLPISITNCTLDEYDFKVTRYTENEAKDLLASRVYNYEQNFLKECDINDRKTEFEVTENGVVETVSYSLYGCISKEVEFFINK